MVVFAKKVIASACYESHLTEILYYGIQTFGYAQAERYFNTISDAVNNLDTGYLQHPECRHLITKGKIYRNIILDTHLIIYRITENNVEVLDIIHSSSSIRKIRTARGVKI
jgi:plasmid stabilization system protein ParE